MKDMGENKDLSANQNLTGVHGNPNKNLGWSFALAQN